MANMGERDIKHIVQLNIMAGVPLSIVHIFILAAVSVVSGSSLTSNSNIVEGKLEIFRRREG